MNVVQVESGNFQPDYKKKVVARFKVLNSSIQHSGKAKCKRKRINYLSERIKETDVQDSGLKAVIIDSGAYTIKAGWSTENLPSLIPNCIMKAKSERKRLFIGNQIIDCRDCSGLYYLLPCERGYITKWDVQKPIWDYVFTKNIPVNDSPVILTQPLFNFKSVQDCTDEVFFEEYEVSSMFRLNPTDLVKMKYCEDFKLSEEDPCVIVDSGFSFSHVIPYINGKKYLSGIRRLNVGGKLLTNHLKDLISYRQYNVMEETYVINQVKEDTCYVADDIREELKKAKIPGKVKINYVLPDFNNIRRGYIQDPNKIDEIAEHCQVLRLNNERFVVPEILFHPSDIGMKSMGLAEAVVKSIYLCPIEYQRNLAKNIVLVGGNCKFSTFKHRMFAELRSLLPHNWKVNVFQPDDPITYTWSGGKSLLKKPTFKSLLVTKHEYEELGSQKIQQRFNHWMTNMELRTEKKRVIDDDYDDELLQSPSYFSENLKALNTLFGKQNGIEDRINSVEETSNTSVPEIEENSASSNAVEDNSSPISDETSSGDGLPTNSETECAPTAASGPGRKSKPRSVKNNIVDEETDYIEEEDLTESTELFPFGSKLYL